MGRTDEFADKVSKRLEVAKQVPKDPNQIPRWFYTLLTPIVLGLFVSMGSYFISKFDGYVSKELYKAQIEALEKRIDRLESR